MIFQSSIVFSLEGFELLVLGNISPILEITIFKQMSLQEVLENFDIILVATRTVIIVWVHVLFMEYLVHGCAWNK